MMHALGSILRNCRKHGTVGVAVQLPPQRKTDAPSAAKLLRAKAIRIIATAAVFAAVFGGGAGALWAADGGWPAFELAKDYRGPGFYLSWGKILTWWLLFLLWVKTTDWASTDAQDLKLNYLRWNPILFGTFLGATVLSWLLPSFWIAFPLMLLAYAVPLTLYILYRNAKVDNNRRVMTPEHLRFCFATVMGKLGVKIATERRDPRDLGPPVKLAASGGPDDRENSARTLRSRQSLGLIATREVLAEAFDSRGTAIMLEYTQQAVTVRTKVDGVWIAHEPRSRENADPVQETLKLLCGLNPQDRQNRQEGAFTAEYKSTSYDISFASQGTPTGERVMMQFEDKKIRFKTLDELGMRTKLQEQLQEQLVLPQGLLLISAPQEGGLRSTMHVILLTCDRFTREFATLEEESNRYQEVENVPVTTYKAADGQTPDSVLQKFFRTEPNVAIIRDLVNAETASMMCDEISEARLLMTTVRAKDCAEALLRVLALGVPQDQFAKAISAVLNLRLVRKLCESCKEAYTPTPQVLQQLGIPEGRVQAFYRPPTPNPEEPKEPCTVCGGIGYYGRTAIFELLVVGDAVRKALASNPKLDVVRQAARKDGMKNLQEEGVLLVARGVTSLPELMRVLKQ
jgi:type II secretory ATPase GspE/PulE/Tfp pilus assembly ATPase PilB-like protein